MNFLWIKTNRLIKFIFSNYVWNISNGEKKVYLTFDDGPTPEITEWVLEQLKTYNAKATFFCIGNNMAKHPEIFKRLLNEGHTIGNHTQNHVKGWKTENNTYFEEVEKCDEVISKHTNIDSKLFRPPYGKIKPSQSIYLRKIGYKIIMWDVLSADFDTTISKEKCLENVLKNVESGSIIVFHDSIKAFPNLEYTLPKTLEFLSKNGYVCDRIN
ncbi:polysaccharide deacetylase family protein [Flavobacterium sp.]|uniref:polysaccharide deacetylase family protein n=1 Tax=Flavobacterium sp. TaxID=239 RepID=UPI0025C57C7F|nr:polysaccharide deacetylase family protein [Flavobacterium sp.]MBA4155029.1 polysaccharide deacetylase family protein [Flavobacterium sp.]